MLVLFFWAWNLAKSYFSGLANFLAISLGFAKFLRYFLGSDKFPAIFWVFQFLCHTLESFAWRTHSTEKLNHSSFSYLFELRQTLHLESFYFSGFEFWGVLFFWVWILGHSIFLGLNFGALYFLGFEFRVILLFWVVEICSRTIIPVKEMLVPPLGKEVARKLRNWLPWSFAALTLMFLSVLSQKP